MEKPQEIITSKQNPLVMLTASLAERKYRRKEGLFRFDGKKLLLEALAANIPLHAVLLKASAADALLAETGALSLPDSTRAVLLSDAVFDRLSEEKAPEGVIVVAPLLSNVQGYHGGEPAFDEALLPGHTLLLESVRDPGNLGTIIRSASAFGIANLVLSADCADPYHPRVIRGAMGTLFHHHITVVEDPVAAALRLRERGAVYAATLKGDSRRLGEIAFGSADTVMVGNEGHGLSRALINAASGTVFIPMETGVESLNAGVAASVLAYELYRGRCQYEA
ncbi:MAG: RNA methyltransferase [Clostridia bacterium]|nr:RNA methyltransferase [Clostridia bacterium]